MISMTVISVAVVGVMGSITSSSSLAKANRETSLAYRAAQRTIEQIQGTDFHDVWARYNATGADDPGGADTAPGNSFVVRGLDPQTGDADGVVGRVSFPISLGGGPSIVMVDDLDEPDFDLSEDRPVNITRNYDDDVDISNVQAIDPSTGYLLLPVRVEVEWTGISGDRSISIETILAPR